MASFVDNATLEELYSYNGSLNETSTSFVNHTAMSAIPEGCVPMELFQFIPWDNKDNLVPKEVDNIVNLVLAGICLPVFFVISFTTNILNMIVFYRHGLQERINACLFTLSLVDLLGVTVAFSYSSDVVYMYAIGKGGDLGPAPRFFMKHFLTGLMGFITASQMVYTFIALERCLCVTRPLLVKSFLPTKTTVVALWTMVVVITGGYVFIGGIRYNVICVFNPQGNSVSFVNYPREFYLRHKDVLDALYSGVYGFFFPAFSLISVTVCTVITAIKLKQLTQWREKVSSASSAVTAKDLATTRVIIGTSVLFIICIIPGILMRTTFLLFPGFRPGGGYDNLGWIIRRCYQIFSAVNNTFNFFVYYNYGSKFRETTRGLFPFCLRE